MASPGLFAFGPYRLDVQERQLRRGTDQVPLPPKLFDLLSVLVERAGQLVHKHELLDSVWGDVAVEEGSLTRAISSLRQLLGASPDGRDYIQTVAKRGYRFTAPLRETAGDQAGDQAGAALAAALALPPQLGGPASVEFVGRQTELRQIDEVWERARNGRPQLLMISGEPGIGKTRLAIEFARARAAKGATILFGCSDEEVLVPYQPFVESLTWHVRSCGESDLRAQLAAAGGGGELLALIPELDRRIPGLTPPAPMDPEAQRYRLFEAVTGVLSAASSSRPIVLVLDDLHWADKASLLLLRHVTRAARAARLAIVATYRESELGRLHPLADALTTLRREHNVTRLSLRGIDMQAIGGLVRAMLGASAPPMLAQLIADISEGNPFFATEMLRHLNESGAVAGAPTSRSGPDSIAALGLPEGITEVVGRRLSRLSDVSNHLLGVAAVIGREFDAALLQEVVGVPDDAFFEALEQASRAQLIAESREVSGRFTFTHVLVRETLYGELSSPRRMKLHGMIAHAIERTMPRNRVPPLADLAHHFTRAGSAGSVEKAIEYATRAGDRAADLLAHEEAVRLFDMALQSVDVKAPDPAAERQRVDLHARRARSFDALGEWTREIGELEAALSHLDSAAVEHRCELMLQLARASFLLLDSRPVEHYAQEAMQLARTIDRPDLEASAMAWLARCRQADGDLESAIEIDRRAMALAPGATTVAHMMGPLSLYLAGRSSDALAVASEAATVARSSRDITFIMYALSHLGLNLMAVGRYADASTAFTDARTFGRKYGALPMLARVTTMASGLHLTVFDFDGAEALQCEARELARSARFAPSVVSANIDTVLTCARRHDPGRAEQLLEETTADAASIGGWHQWLWRLRLAQAGAELALARNAAADAIQLATEAIERSQAGKRPKYEALGFVTRARSFHATGRTHAAIGDARRAVGIATALGDPALLLLALDVLLALDGTDDLAAEARMVSGRIGDALPDATMREQFCASEVVERARRS